MRSKRMMALLALSFFLIFPAASGKGNAENILYAELLSGAVTREWQEQYGIRVERAWHDGQMNLTEVLQAEDAPDFFCISTQNADFEAIRNAGWLADLSASASIREDIASLPPVFRAALESEDGTIWGIPEAASFKYEVYWLPAAWEAMGWDTKRPRRPTPNCWTVWKRTPPIRRRAFACFNLQPIQGRSSPIENGCSACW